VSNRLPFATNDVSVRHKRKEKDMAQKILIVEDEEKIARFVELELLHEGYEAEKVFDGRTGLDKALSGGFDLVVLDVMTSGTQRSGGASKNPQGE